MSSLISVENCADVRHRLSVQCTYQPVNSVQQLERFVPCPDAEIHPDYPQWQSLTLEGGHQIAHKGQRQDVDEEAGIHAEVGAFVRS